MTVSTSINSVVYRGNGAATQFAVPFKVIDVDHLRVRRRVYATGVIDYTYVGTDYSYVGIGASSGTLTLVGTALSSTYELVIERIVPYTQDLDIVNAGGFYPETVEEQLDLMTMGIQQIADLAGRGITVPVGESGFELTSPADRAGKFFGFDAEGDFVAASGTGSDGALRTDLANPASGDLLVATKNTGASAVSRTSRAKMREIVQARDNGATGLGVANDYAALVSTLADYVGREIKFSGTYLTRTRLEPGANTTISGEGHGTVIKTDTASNHLIFGNAPDLTVRDLSFEGVLGGDALNNGAVILANLAQRGVVDHVEASGMAGAPFYCGSGAKYGNLNRLYVHDLTGDHQNSCDVLLYSDCQGFTVSNSLLFGGPDTEVGIICQTNSGSHDLLFNRIEAHDVYALLNYAFPTATSTWTMTIGNRATDIDGAKLGGSSGAGYYFVDIGGDTVAFNYATRCNINTTNESLTPAGFGINGTTEPISLIGNYSHRNYWHGYMLVNGDEVVSLIGNGAYENRKDQIYVKASSHAVLLGNSATALNLAGLIAPDLAQERCISVNAITTPKKGIVAVANRTRGSFYRAWEFANTSDCAVVGNVHTEGAAAGGVFDTLSGLTFTSNVFEVTNGTGVALLLSNVTHSNVGGLVLKTGGATALQTTGTCTGLIIDKSVNIYADSGGVDGYQLNPMNFIDNEGVGCIVEAYGTAAPTLHNHQVGDTVINRTPAVGQPIGWKCTVAGVPGTWVAMANL